MATKSAVGEQIDKMAAESAGAGTWLDVDTNQPVRPATAEEAADYGARLARTLDPDLIVTVDGHRCTLA